MKKKMLSLILAGIMFGGAALPVYAGETRQKHSVYQRVKNKAKSVCQRTGNCIARISNSICEWHDNLESDNQVAVDIPLMLFVGFGICCGYNYLETGQFMPVDN